MRIGIIFMALSVFLLGILMYRSLHAPQSLPPGIYTLQRNGYEFSILIRDDGHFIQTLALPDKSKYESHGTWRLVPLHQDVYFNAQNVFLGSICEDYSDGSNSVVDSTEITFPLYRRFGLWPAILACSDGRSLVKE